MSLDQKSPPTQAPISCFCKHFVAPANKQALRINTDVNACPQDGPKKPKISLQSNKSAGYTPTRDPMSYRCKHVVVVANISDDNTIMHVVHRKCSL